MEFLKEKKLSLMLGLSAASLSLYIGYLYISDYLEESKIKQNLKIISEKVSLLEHNSIKIYDVETVCSLQ